jgi:hypothetical protein
MPVTVVTPSNAHRAGRRHPYDGTVHTAHTVYGWHSYPGVALLGLSPPFDVDGGVMAIGVTSDKGERMHSTETREDMVVEGKRRWCVYVYAGAYVRVLRWALRCSVPGSFRHLIPSLFLPCSQSPPCSQPYSCDLQVLCEFAQPFIVCMS